MRIIQLACAGSLLFAATCAETRPPPAAVAADVPLAAATEAVYAVGAVDGEDWETFGRVRGVAFDAEGNLHVLDAGAYRVVVVGPEGGLVRTVGSRGEGPGEVSSPQSFAVLDDGRIAVFDESMPGNFEIFGPDGGYLGTAPADLRAGTPGRFLLPLPDGRMVSTGGNKFAFGGEDLPEEPEDAHLRDIDVFSLDGSGKEVFYRAWNLPPAELLDEVAVVDDAGREHVSMDIRRMRAFEPGLSVAVMADGRVAVADSVTYRIKLLSADGMLVGAIGRRVPPEPVTEAIRAAQRERWAEGASDRVARQASFLGITDEAEVQRMLDQSLARIESMIFPDGIPVIAAMAVDREGRVWVERAAPGGDGDGPIDILTPEGEYVGTLAADGPRIPDAFGPGGLMAYVERDEMGVASVRVIRLASLEREG